MIDEREFPCWADSGYNIAELLRVLHAAPETLAKAMPPLGDADVERIAGVVLQKMLEREQVRAFADAGLTAEDVARELRPADLEALRRMDGT